MQDKEKTGKAKVDKNQVRFNLKNKTTSSKKKIDGEEVIILRKAKDPILIRAVYRYSQGKLVYSTKHKIEPDQWDNKKQLPRVTHPFYDDLKRDLDKIALKIRQVHSEHGSITFKEFRDKLDEELGRKKEEERKDSNSMLNWIDAWIKRREKLADRNILTIRKYKTILKRLRIYSGTMERPIEWEDINRAFVEDYTYWLYEETAVSSANTANKEYSILTYMMSEAYADKIHTNDFFRGKQFSIPRVKTTKVALTENEVDQLYSYDYEDNDRYTEVRDWFVISCDSALRISDLRRIKRAHIQKEGGHNLLKMIARKTDKRIVIPASDRIIELLDKHDYKFPKISENEYNKLIKAVSKKAGITAKVILKKSVKGKTEGRHFEKWEKLSSHSGRKTWASINYLKGLPIQLLMNVTQHSSEKTFLSYVDLTEEQKTLKLIKEMNEKARIIDINKSA